MPLSRTLIYYRHNISSLGVEGSSYYETVTGNIDFKARSNATETLSQFKYLWSN